jgi:hypothetical protein
LLDEGQELAKPTSGSLLLGSGHQAAIEHLLELALVANQVGRGVRPHEDVDEEVDPVGAVVLALDRKSTRLNSSHK